MDKFEITHNDSHSRFQIKLGQNRVRLDFSWLTDEALTAVISARKIAKEIERAPAPALAKVAPTARIATSTGQEFHIPLPDTSKMKSVPPSPPKGKK